MNSLFDNYGGYGYGYGSIGASIITTVIILLVAIGGGIALYFTFLSSKNDRKFTGFLGWLYDFLTFKKLMVEELLKILYLICTIYFVLTGIVGLFSSFLGGLMTIVMGVVLTRIVYEFTLITILICKNVIDINRKMKGSDNAPQPNIFTAAPTAAPKQPTPAPVQPVSEPAAPVETPVEVPKTESQETTQE